MSGVGLPLTLLLGEDHRAGTLLPRPGLTCQTENNRHHQNGPKDHKGSRLSEGVVREEARGEQRGEGGSLPDLRNHRPGVQAINSCCVSPPGTSNLVLQGTHFTEKKTEVQKKKTDSHCPTLRQSGMHIQLTSLLFCFVKAGRCSGTCHLLTHLPCVCNSWRWAKQKPGAWNSVNISHMGGRDTAT